MNPMRLVWTFGLFVVAALATIVLPAPKAAAEPWLSTRYAQNCAGCHAPGRKNLPAMDRRCTLSCQGCHVNPNGGGLRSQYGKWNEDRWLRTFRSDALKNASSFASTPKQVYGVKTWEKFGAKLDEGTGKQGVAKGPGKNGFPLVEVAGADMPEELFKREPLGQRLEEKISATDAEFYYQVPQGDPLRQMDQSKVDAGGDIRWEAVSMTQTVPDGSGGKKTVKTWANFLMDADFGLRYRPLYHNVSLVYESRIQGSPAANTHYEDFLLSARTRSLYAMVDDLPFNTFVMGGYYRPLFGNYVPDHYSLGQEMTSYAMSGKTQNYNLLYEAVSIGTAPNVPYLNLHLIRKNHSTPGDDADQTRGFATNLGARWVTLGASFNYSYWRTSDARADGATTQVEMHAVTGAARLFRTMTSLELLSTKRDTDTKDFRQGGVITLDTYTQVFKENYFTLMFAHANTTAEILPGEARQVKAGVRSFIIPGVDTSLALESRTDTTKDPKTAVTTVAKTSGIEAQLHLFF